ncbi:MAG: hypothetical protein ACETWQ_00200 [Phycisphaerae bacterium]
MMLKKIKFGKIAIVIFLTVLIWVWADLALEELFPVSNMPITISKSTNRALWVSFVDENESLVPVYIVKSIVLKGSASRTSDVDRKLKTGSLQLDFFLDAEQEGMDKPGKYPLDVLNLLRKSNQIRELGLAVQSCEPDKLTINVVELVKKSLDIECFNESGAPLGVESIDPPKVVMAVPADSRLTAQVRLTPRDIEQARLSVVVKTPYVILAPDQIRQAPTTVKIKMPSEADSLSEHTITEAKLGIELSVNLQGEYKPDVINHNDVVRPFTIQATLEAKQAYENQPFQMTLYILDGDEKKGPQEEQRRKVVYNFPEEFVRKDEIRLKSPQQPAEARFKLIRLTSAPTPPSGPD